MVSRTYYLPMNRNGFTDTSLVNVRKTAIDHMKKTGRRSMTIYTSHTRKIEIGTIVHSPSNRSLYVWCYRSMGKDMEAPILPDGNISRKDH